MSTVSDGSRAEQAVAEELIRRGYKIIELNWKTKFAEIDIVAEKDGTLCFVEVKYRRTNVAGDGFDYITPNKLHHMRRAAEAYVLEYSWNEPYELLAAAISGSPESYELDVREIA